ncbi:MAG: hypothetical protein FWD73_03110 [Polyangiaceae bacterium]|nr:hypothetical protein [Polyangiaceae bacterium]
MKSARVFVATFLAVGGLMGSTHVHAEETAQSEASAARSLRTGFGASQGHALRRIQQDKTMVTKTIMQTLVGDASSTPAQDIDGSVRAIGGDWTVRVDRSGASTRGSRNIKPALGMKTKLTADALDRAGRSFIASSLKGVIALLPNEQIVALATKYEIFGGQTKPGEPIEEHVIGNRIFFGRTIDGVPVVGGGSTITMTFSSDGTIQSFEYDWPAYTTDKADAPIADQAELLHRVQQVGVVRTGNGTKASLSPIVTDRGFPTSLAPNVNLTRFECGYFDPGPNQSNIAFISPGGTYEAVSTTTGPQGTLRYGIAGAVPAFASFSADPAWPETMALLGQAPTYTPPPSSQ